MARREEKPVVKLHEVVGERHVTGPDVKSTAKPPRAGKVVPVDPKQKSAEAGESDMAAQDRISERGADTVTPIYEALDHTMQVWLSRFTRGLSPAAVTGAWFEWATHIAAEPGKRHCQVVCGF